MHQKIIINLFFHYKVSMLRGGTTKQTLMTMKQSDVRLHQRILVNFSILEPLY